MASSRARAYPLGLALLLLACSKSRVDTSAGGRVERAPTAAVSVAPGPASAVASVAPTPREPICRALRVEGDAKLGEAALASGAELDGSEWVRLAKGARVTLKHAGSGRELSLAGPALFRACRRGREQVLLAQGQVTVGSGMGARPGAEVLVATPVAGVRYADAEFSLRLDDKRLTLEVRAGQVQLDTAPSGGAAPAKAPKSALHAKDKLVIPLGKPDAAALMSRCQVAAEAAEASARKVGDKSSPEPLGERAKTHVLARKTARSTCTMAAAATGLVADPAAAAGLWADALRWEGLWESIPRPARAQAPEK